MCSLRTLVGSTVTPPRLTAAASGWSPGPSPRASGLPSQQQAGHAVVCRCLPSWLAQGSALSRLHIAREGSQPGKAGSRTTSHQDVASRQVSARRGHRPPQQASFSKVAAPLGQREEHYSPGCVIVSSRPESSIPGPAAETPRPSLRPTNPGSDHARPMFRKFGRWQLRMSDCFL